MRKIFLSILNLYSVWFCFWLNIWQEFVFFSNRVLNMFPNDNSIWRNILSYNIFIKFMIIKSYYCTCFLFIQLNFGWVSKRQHEDNWSHIYDLQVFFGLFIVSCSIVSLVLCSFVLYIYLVYPGTRAHPNQIVIHHAYVTLFLSIAPRSTDLVFSICVLLSIRLFYAGDTNCQSVTGKFVAVLTQYSLLGSELSYFCLAIDALVSVSRPFSNPKTRYT